MNTEGITKNWKVLNAGAEEGALIGAAASFGISLPWDYVDFLRNHNGGEGFVGEEYLMLWRAEELKRFNDEYQVSEYAPGLLFFGSDGGGDGYAFDTRTNSMPVVSVPFIGMDLKHARRVADTFAELLSKLGK